MGIKYASRLSQVREEVNDESLMLVVLLDYSCEIVAANQEWNDYSDSDNELNYEAFKVSHHPAALGIFRLNLSGYGVDHRFTYEIFSDSLNFVL